MKSTCGAVAHTIRLWFLCRKYNCGLERWLLTPTNSRTASLRIWFAGLRMLLIELFYLSILDRVVVVVVEAVVVAAAAVRGLVGRAALARRWCVGEILHAAAEAILFSRMCECE